jgi:hypothetical protein
MKKVGDIAELIVRGMEEDSTAQDGVVKLMEKAKSDPEFEHYMRDAAARVKEGRVKRTKEKDTERMLQEIEGEASGADQPTEREAKLLRLLFEAKTELRRLKGAEEGVRAGETGTQDARVPQSERGSQASAVSRGKEGSGQERGQPRTRPQTVPQGNRTLQGGQQNG